MRIITGRFGRRQIKAPEGLDVRPTADRVREALFSALESRGAVAGAHVLDLFAGTGALALEALSRGATGAVLVEQNAKALAALGANVRTLGVAREVTVVRGDVLAWLARRPTERFTLAFADPPYDLPELPDLPDRIRPHLAPGALFVLEHDARHTFADRPDLLFSRPYGRTVVSIFGIGESGNPGTGESENLESGEPEGDDA